ncbi:MAG: hypothetical protein M0007_00335, partial [Actinomycetota bacterium]|nr:hypothetical protein [Actinomycetota bacterium]
SLGLVVWRRRVTPSGLLWLLAVALAIRGYFEPVMTPYYLAPPLAVGIVVVAGKGRARLAVAVAISFAMTVFGYYHLSPWAWWAPMMVGMTAVLALGFPGTDAIDLRRRRVAASTIDEAAWFAEDPTDAGADEPGVEDGAGPSERPERVLASREPLDA